jgi:hypothetical protein
MTNKSELSPDRSSVTSFLAHLLANINTNQYQNETNEINKLLLRLETLRLIDLDEPFQLIPWLKHFSPCFLQMYPNKT